MSTKSNQIPQQVMSRSVSRGEASAITAMNERRRSSVSMSQLTIENSDIPGSQTIDPFRRTSNSITMAHAVPLDDSMGVGKSQLMTSVSMMEADEGGMSTFCTAADGLSPSLQSNAPDNAEHSVEDDDSLNRAVSCAGEEQEEEESDYEYDYEDDDDGHFQGFLAPTEPEMAIAPYSSAIPSNPNLIENTDAATSDTPQVQTDEIKDIEMTVGSSAVPLSAQTSDDLDITETHEELSKLHKKTSWKEPSKAAVSMSLRAEREKSGGKRRLASDLYKIMMGDTTEQGFKMEPSSEDSMDVWTIKLFGFDKDSNLHKDMELLALENIELEMSFPDDYPFAPPFVRVVRPRFKRQTGFVMNGALCMELLTSDGWNPVNDIESVIVSIRSLLVVGDGRLAAAAQILNDESRNSQKKSPAAGESKKEGPDAAIGLAEAPEAPQQPDEKRRKNETGAPVAAAAAAAGFNQAEWMEEDEPDQYQPGNVKKRLSGKITTAEIGSYSASEARSAYSHLSAYHKRKGWDSSGWWARKG